MPCDGCESEARGPRAVVSWRLWSDGDRFESPAPVALLPNDGILAICLYYADGRRRRIEGADWYFLADHDEGVIWGSAMERPDPVRYRLRWSGRGRYVPDVVMAEIDDEIERLEPPS